MFPSLLVRVILSALLLPVKPSTSECWTNVDYDYILRHFANNIASVCQTEATASNYVRYMVNSCSCNAFDEDACKDSREIFEYFYNELKTTQSVHNICYYKAFYLFFNSCDCYKKIAEKLPRNVCGNSRPRSKVLTPYIVGGEVAKYREFPWMASFQRNIARCGAALIGTRYVLTAAHCAVYGKNYPLSIGLGSNDILKPAMTVGVEKIIIHPRFYKNDYGNYNDIALLKLSEDVPFNDDIQPICLPNNNSNYEVNHSDHCYVAGWGRNKVGILPRYLHTVRVPLLTSRVCKQYVQGFKPGHVCAGYYNGGKDSCKGDSGGPLMCRINNQWFLTGIVSFGNYCARPRNPGVYTDVQFYLKWILNHIQ